MQFVLCYIIQDKPAVFVSVEISDLKISTTHHLGWGSLCNRWGWDA